MDTRKWPRTMNEAFPRSAEYGCAIEQPYRRSMRPWIKYAIAVMVIGAITLLINSTFIHLS